MTEQTSPSGTALEILIVEDSPLEAEMLRRILVRAGYRVVVAKNGEEGLQALREHPCTLVMSDINMPRMDGYELCHAIKLDEKLWHTPVILVTMLSEPKDIIKALDVGADGYITKPYVEDVLLGRIRSLLANPARRKLADERRKIQLEYGGEQHSVAVDSPQMANLLLSVYENSLTLNQELMRIQNQLNLLNETLEEKVHERTAALQENEEKFRIIFDEAKDGIVLTDAESGLVADCNAEFERQCGRPLAEIKTLHIWELRPPALQEAARRKFEEIKASGRGSAELGFQRPDGSFMPAEFVATRVRTGDRNYLISISRDITERKQIEAARKFLAESGYAQRGGDFFQLLAKFLAETLAMDYVCIDRLEGDQLSAQTVAIYFDGKFEDNVSYTLKDTPCGDVVAKKVCCFTKDVRQLFPQDAVLQEMLAESYVGTTLFNFTGKPIGLIAVIGRQPLASPHLAEDLLQMVAVRAAAELERQKSEGELREMLRIANQSRRAMLSVIQDQKKADAATQHANRALATLSAVNRNLVHATDENELLQAICQAIVEQRNYRLAWVGYKQRDASKSIRIMARAGHDEGYLDGMQFTWSESEQGMGPSGRTVRSSSTQLCQDIANDPLFLPWRTAALQRGYAASIALPLLNGDHTVFGVLNVYSGEVNDFTPNEVALLEEMAGDMAFGVRSLHTRHERDLALEQNQQQLLQLRDSLEDTVRAMAGLVEMRDPYTAGHQARVADLAAAIAKQMGLPDEQAHAIHLAGTVHDLGKVNIPAEILSKPGKITDIDFNLIKTHPQAGYDILQGIDFPWPIAQMVLQHHERLDGSGYPQGLKGEAILLEARILAVADVVEAISAHRPYRPGFGIEVALEEIAKNRGNFYDPQVADACLTLFREQYYSFKS